MPEPAERIRSAWGALSPLPAGTWLFSRLLGWMVPYTGSIGAEFMHIPNAEQRRWVHEKLERGGGKYAFTAPERRRALQKLTQAEGLERRQLFEPLAVTHGFHPVDTDGSALEVSSGPGARAS